ncbi:hypothetical protein O181_108964 [Austropuccinia psidii MF-1]|uniref:Uncharacterized protein n=1 Tax=Austropuccinia psidii MF-1 TaxID=1389203 RepID=A0A9Q3JVR8_9BASI|nr:hypothetical protein [Austropuccinia psidii MF-1]
MLMRPHPPPDETLTLPPISTLNIPYASTPLLLTIFTLLQHPQDETTMPPSPLLMLPHPSLIFSLAYNSYAPAGRSGYASDATLTLPYASSHPPLTILMLMECLPNMPPMPLTILMLCPPDMPLTPLTILMLTVPSRHASDAAYHPYAHVVPSQHASNAPSHWRNHQLRLLSLCS